MEVVLYRRYDLRMNDGRFIIIFRSNDVHDESSIGDLCKARHTIAKITIFSKAVRVVELSNDFAGVG